MTAGLFLPIFGLALGGLRNPWAFTAAALLLWGAAASQRRLPKIPFAPLWGIWLAWAALSALSSAEPWRGLSDLAYRASAMCVFLLALSAHEDGKKTWRLFLLITIPAFELVSYFIHIRGYAKVGVLFPYYNYTAAVAAIGATLGLAAIFSKEDEEQALGWICLLASWTWLLWSGSRGGPLAAGVGSLTVLMRLGYKTAAKIFVFAGAVAILGLFASGSGRLKIGQMKSNLRPQLWKSAIAVAADSPFLGEGPGQFDRGFLRHNFPASFAEAHTRYGRHTDHAHSEFLEEAAEIGWPGALILTFVILMTFRLAWMHGNPEVGALGAAAALLTHGLFDNIFALPALEWMFFSFLGASLAPRNANETRFPPAWIAAGILLTIFSSWPKWIVDTARADGSEPALHRALTFTPKDHTLWSDIARARIAANNPGGAVQAFFAASQLHPTEAVYPLWISQIAHRAGRWQDVLYHTARVIELEPKCPQARLLRANAFLALGRRDNARSELKTFHLIVKPLAWVKMLWPGQRFVLGHDVLLLKDLENRLSN